MGLTIKRRAPCLSLCTKRKGWAWESEGRFWTCFEIPRVLSIRRKFHEKIPQFVEKKAISQNFLDFPMNGSCFSNSTISRFLEKLLKETFIPFTPISKVPEFLIDWKASTFLLIPNVLSARILLVSAFLNFRREIRY